MKIVWTIEALIAHYNQRFESLQTAVDKAETFAKEKFENTNEWRKSYDDLTRTYMPRLEYESNQRTIVNTLSELKTEIEKIKNMKSGGYIVWHYVVTIGSLLIAAAAIFLK